MLPSFEMVLNEIKPWATPNFVDTTYELLNEDHYEKDVEFVCWPLIRRTVIEFVEEQFYVNGALVYGTRFQRCFSSNP